MATWKENPLLLQAIYPDFSKEILSIEQKLPKVYIAANQKEQDKISPKQGDIVIRTDLNKTYIFSNSSWHEILSPVRAVDGQTGQVVLDNKYQRLGTLLYPDNNNYYYHFFTVGYASTGYTGLNYNELDFQFSPKSLQTPGYLLAFEIYFGIENPQISKIEIYYNDELIYQDDSPQLQSGTIIIQSSRIYSLSKPIFFDPEGNYKIKFFFSESYKEISFFSSPTKNNAKIELNDNHTYENFSPIRVLKLSRKYVLMSNLIDKLNTFLDKDFSNIQIKSINWIGNQSYINLGPNTHIEIYQLGKLIFINANIEIYDWNNPELNTWNPLFGVNINNITTAYSLVKFYLDSASDKPVFPVRIKNNLVEIYMDFLPEKQGGYIGQFSIISFINENQ